MAIIENTGVSLANEAKILDCWRKKYLGQAVVVLLLAICGVAAAWFYANVYWSAASLTLIIFIIAYLMLKELREEVQTRGEELILAKSEQLFPELFFDVGRGLDENTILNQNILPPYRMRECRNVMRGNGYLLEEDWLYNVSSIKSIPITHTIFEGVVLAVPAKRLLKEGHAAVFGSQFNGTIAQSLRESGTYMAILSLMELFCTKEAETAVYDGSLYIWMKTEQRLFYKFSLLNSNSLMAFVYRIHTLDAAVKKLLHTLDS